MSTSRKERFIREDRRPLYEQAQSVMLARIMEGVYQSGEKLPPEDQLANSLGVSRATIRSTLSHLETLGYIRRVHGAGTFITGNRFKIEAQLDTLESFHPRLAARMGRSSRITQLDIREVPATTEIAAAMGLHPDEPVISITRIVEIDELPIIYLQDFLPTSSCSCTVESLQASFDSVVDYFDGSEGRPLIQWSDSDFETLRADDSLSHLLQVKVGELLFQLDEVFYASDGVLVSWSRNYIVPEYFKFHIRRKVVHGEGNGEFNKNPSSNIAPQVEK
jgi:GntR family transcriptional regulator